MSKILKSVLGGAVAVCIALSPTMPLADELLPIRIASARSADHLPTHFASQTGIYERHGLDAEIILFPTGVEMINALMAGDVDVTTMGSVPFIASASQGLPVMLISHYHGDATSDSYAPFALVARGDLGLEYGALEGLRGRTIGLPRGAATEPFVIAIMRQAGIEPTEYQIVNLAAGSMVAALLQGSVDAVAIWKPWGQAAIIEAGGTLIQEGGCNTCYDPGTHLTSRAHLADPETREALRRFVASVAESARWARANHDQPEAVEVASRFIDGVSPEVLALALSSSSFDPRLSENTVRGLQLHTIPLLAQDGRANPDLDPRTIIDFSLQQEVMAEFPQFFDDLPAIQ